MTGKDRSGPAHKLRLHRHAGQLAVCRLAPHAPVPAWATTGSFHAVTRTSDELSIVCDFDAAPTDVESEGPWSCLEVEGPLDFSLTGILASLALPLAEAGVSVFAISTYRTDYLLVPMGDLEAAVSALSAAGHAIH